MTDERWYVSLNLEGGFSLKRGGHNSGHVHESWLHATPTEAVAHYKERLRKTYERHIADLDAALKATERDKQ